jgi:hypothetical protein
MPLTPDSILPRIVRRLLPYTSAAVILTALYVAWVFVSRWNDNRRMEQAAEASKAKPADPFTQTYNSGQLKILSFYATPGLVMRGDKALLCYGVVEAKTVRIEPKVEGVWPAVSRCVEVSPMRNTRYTLTAEDGQGHSATESIVVRVK